MDPHCIVCGTRMSQYPWHWMICFVPLPCQSGINTTSTHTPPVSRVLPTLFSVFSIAIPLPQSVIFSNYHLPSSKSQGSSVPGFMFLVNHVQGVCSTLCNTSVTPGLNINIPSPSLQTRGLHAPTITHTSTDTMFPSCIRRKPTFVL